MTSASLVLCLLPAAPADNPPGRLDLEPGELRPGLVAEYRTLTDQPATLTRVEPKPSFYLGRSSPHPSIPPGPFEVVWSGVITLKEPGPVSFSALAGGEVSVIVDGVTVLDGCGPTDTSRVTAKAALKREPGSYRLTVRYRSIADVPARLQLWWEGPSFAPEPLPAWRLGHLTADRSPALERADLAAEGRAAVGRFGCARCHQGAFPGVTDPPPGPSLADAGRRLGKGWLLTWLADPAKVRPDAHMPALFAPDRAGFVDRWIVAEHLIGSAKRAEDAAPGDHRKGRTSFLSLGCAACHFVPDLDRAGQKDLGRVPLTGLGDRLPAGDLAAFLTDPHGRYPDRRMPRLPVTPAEARDIAAYLLLWSKPSVDPPAAEPPTAAELQDALRRLGARDQVAAAAGLLNEKGCTACHTGLGESRPRDIPVRAADDRGCLGGKTGPRYSFPAETRKTIGAYLSGAAAEKHPSPFAARQHQLARAGCVRCHQRDHDRQPPIEEVGSTFGGSQLEEVPFLRTPKLTNPHQKFRRDYLGTAVREGVTGVRWARYSYRMPAFGPDAEVLVRALAEADGELPAEPDVPVPGPTDPTLATVHGPQLVGFQGYGCASCHVWNGKLLASPDPGATGPDLTRTAGRLRRDWFDRYLESPMRFYPGTPMPSIFEHGKPASIGAILDGDPAKQKDALWAYLARGKDAPSPAPPPPLPIPAPAKDEPALVAQIPIRLPDGRVVESICLLSADHDLVVYDLAAGGPHTLFTGGQVLRNVQGRVRQFLATGKATDLTAPPTLQLLGRGAPEAPTERTLLGYDRLPDGARVRWQLRFGGETVGVQDTLRLVTDRAGRRLTREVHLTGLPKGIAVELGSRVLASGKTTVVASVGDAQFNSTDQVHTAKITPNAERTAAVMVRYDLPPARPAPAWDGKAITFADAAEGSLVRPGYRAIAYPRPKTISGEDRIMPAAVAVRPRDGQVFVASLKTGELFALRDPTGDGRDARFENYGRGLYQDALSMLAEDDGLYVLHRRNLTKIADSSRTSPADRFDRVLALPHGVADTYDMAYGLVHDKLGRFVLSYAPYANTTMPGSGGVLRLSPGKPPEEVAFGLRNPLGWCAGPGGEVFFTDNQGDWVATNKLCHVDEGRFYGWPNRAQKQHTTKPAGKPTVWVPYGWARSINGVAYDNTGGKFGPFAGQFFMAELMFGGAIVRANVEQVNGVYQGACFPFWGKGLLGPVSLAFDPRGRLYVGGITEPGWMAQPDRGALFGIDFTGKMPFEMQSIHARPGGFRVVFTAPVDAATAGNPASYRLEQYRYEYTGAYGSPELDRTAVKVERVRVAADGLSAELTTAPLVTDRVYLITAAGVRSAAGETLVHPTGAYTLNEIPAK
ncbi:MAG: Cytochrome c [Gemmataceae bacterium]|nr:Cytochrome c [Gemmataceae bacterium]